ncbi:hypothetical protein LTR56_005213 [Elasticomyces elasticus]|nr:hypothetical protein LTR56_005213 [Elasticomyces elasticus]
MILTRTINKRRPAVSSRKYVWEPLDPTKHSIRLVSILPCRNEDDTLRLTLRTTDHDAFEPYDATSYMWGSDSSLHEISIDDKIVLVRYNIWQFLIHARDSPLHDQLNSSLWIDSISIDQSNNEEKNRQVRQMRTTFSRARRVIAWLGEASLQRTFSDCAAALKSQMSPGLTYEQDPEALHALSGYVRALRWQTRHSDDDDGDNTRRAILNTLRSMCESPYWSRLWIVQELIVAQDAYCVSGDLLLSVSALNGFASLLNAMDENSSEGLAPFWNTMNCFFGDTLGAGTTGFKRSRTLAYTVEALSRHYCMDARDHIYGVLGCVEGGDAFNVDYSITRKAILLRALRLIDKEGDDNVNLRDCLEMLVKLLGLSMQDVYRRSLLREFTVLESHIPVTISSYFEHVPPSYMERRDCDAKDIYKMIDGEGVQRTFRRRPHGTFSDPERYLVECRVNEGWQGVERRKAEGSWLALVDHPRSGWLLLSIAKGSDYVRNDIYAATVLKQFDWDVLRQSETHTMHLPCSFASLHRSVDLHELHQQERAQLGSEEKIQESCWMDRWHDEPFCIL